MVGKSSNNSLQNDETSVPLDIEDGRSSLCCFNFDFIFVLAPSSLYFKNRVLAPIITQVKSRGNRNVDSLTLVSISGLNLRNTLYALWRSQLELKNVRTILITDRKVVNTFKFCRVLFLSDYELNSIDAYSYFCVYELYKHIETEFVLIVQADGYIIHGSKWDDEYLKYDYIGAPWNISNDSYIDPFGKHQRVGNGGFSLRSRKLLELPRHQRVEWDINDDNFYKHMGVNLQSEDGIICIHNRHIYEQAGMVFAPLEIALNFSCEQKIPEYDGRITFGFHKTFPHKWERFLDYAYRVVFFLRYPSIR